MLKIENLCYLKHYKSMTQKDLFYIQKQMQINILTRLVVFTLLFLCFALYKDRLHINSRYYLLIIGIILTGAILYELLNFHRTKSMSMEKVCKTLSKDSLFVEQIDENHYIIQTRTITEDDIASTIKQMASYRDERVLSEDFCAWMEKSIKMDNLERTKAIIYFEIITGHKPDERRKIEEFLLQRK